MGRTRVRRRRAMLAIAAVLAAVWVGPMASALEGGGEPRRAAGERYVVREGDTLWSIAEHLAPGKDPRPLVDAISAANRIDPGVLLPGRTLLVPQAD